MCILFALRKFNYNYVYLGSDIVDQLLSVLLGTSMFVGGLTGFILDNTIPGTCSFDDFFFLYLFCVQCSIRS